MRRIEQLKVRRVGEETEDSGISYSREALESVHRQIQDTKGELFGEIGPDFEDYGSVTESDIVLIVLGSEFDGEELTADVLFVDDEIDLEEVYADIRGYSSIEDDVIQDDIQLIAIDLFWKED